MSDVTRILNAIEQGDPTAAGVLLPLVYNELRKFAASKLDHEKPGQTLDATALVHEAYLRLVGGETPRRFRDRSHFFAAAATATRRILIDIARRKRSQKHGGSCAGKTSMVLPGASRMSSCLPSTKPWRSWPPTTPSRGSSSSCPLTG